MAATYSTRTQERSSSHREDSCTSETSDDSEQEDAASKFHRMIVVVERNAFLRDCLLRSVAEYSEGCAVGCASLSELGQSGAANHAVVLLSTLSLSDEEADAELAQLTDIGPRTRSMVLGKSDDLNKVLLALSQGANGYISISAGFDIFVQALRFVGAGGTYVPAQCLIAAKQAPAPASVQASRAASVFTNREFAVIQAIRKGKPNKVIAYELNLCESTVKVHVRHIMKKLQAKNRTDVAIKSADLAPPPVRPEGVEPAFAFLAAADRGSSDRV